MAPASRGRLVVVIPPLARDTGGFLQFCAAMYGRYLGRAGFEITELRAEDPALVATLERLAAEPTVKAFYSIGGAVLDAFHDQPRRAAAIFDTHRKPVLCHYWDHPFAPWMRRRVTLSFEQHIALYIDPAMIAFMDRFGPRPGMSFEVPHGVLLNLAQPPRPPLPAAERDIAVLFSGNIADVEEERRGFQQRQPDLAAIADRIVEQALPDYRTPIAAVVEAILHDASIPFDPRRHELHDLVAACDWRVRHSRRRRMLSRIKRHPVTIVAQRRVSWPGMHPDCRFLATTPFRDVLELAGRARAILVPQPTYPGGLTERILFAMHAQSAVVATPSPAVSSNFVLGRDLLTVRPFEDDIDDALDLTQDDRFVDEMGQNARTAVLPFMPERIVERYLHLAGATGTPI